MSETNKMDPTWKKKWVDALRSGEYEQGRGGLRSTTDKFCCLGVLTDLCIKEGLTEEWEIGDKDWWEAEGRPGTLPTSTRKATGADYPYIPREGHLATLNDRRGFSFERIADLIEEHL